MLHLLALILMLEDVSPELARALAAVVAEQRETNANYGDPYVKAQAVADLNGDSLVDCVVVFAYAIGEGVHGQVQFLSVVVSSSDGYVASWPVVIGARGFRNFYKVEIEGTRITLRGDFTVSDGTASMAALPATGEVYTRMRVESFESRAVHGYESGMNRWAV